MVSDPLTNSLLHEPQKGNNSNKNRLRIWAPMRLKLIQGLGEPQKDLFLWLPDMNEPIGWNAKFTGDFGFPLNTPKRK